MFYKLVAKTANSWHFIIRTGRKVSKSSFKWLQVVLVFFCNCPVLCFWGPDKKGLCIHRQQRRRFALGRAWGQWHVTIVHTSEKVQGPGPSQTIVMTLHFPLMHVLRYACLCTFGLLSVCYEASSYPDEWRPQSSADLVLSDGEERVQTNQACELWRKACSEHCVN